MKIKFVKEEHVSILLEYLDAPGVVLLFPSAQEEAARLGIEDGDHTPDDYDFGGEADVWVELVTSPDHFLLKHIQGKAWQGLSAAVEEFNKEMDQLILDERDRYPDFSKLVKEHCGTLPQEDKADLDFWNECTSLCEQAEAAVTLAEDLARAYRRGSRVEIARLEEEYFRRKHIEEVTHDQEA